MLLLQLALHEDVLQLEDGGHLCPFLLALNQRLLLCQAQLGGGRRPEGGHLEAVLRC